MKVKICGLRRAVDADAALALGATHLGVVLAQDSPRRATVREARAIVRLARGVATVALVFRGEHDEAIRTACDRVGCPRVQVHGANGVRCQKLQSLGLRPVPVAVVARTASSLPDFDEPPSARNPALLDGGKGGAGRAFVWSLLRGGAPHAVFVAGGIAPFNVRELLHYQPWGIDVSSGIELEPGVKDPVLMSQLFHAVRSSGVSQ